MQRGENGRATHTGGGKTKLGREKRVQCSAFRIETDKGRLRCCRRDGVGEGKGRRESCKPRGISRRAGLFLGKKRMGAIFRRADVNHHRGKGSRPERGEGKRQANWGGVRAAGPKTTFTCEFSKKSGARKPTRGGGGNQSVRKLPSRIG